MSRRAATFTQADVARALRAAEQVAPGRYRVRVTRDGEIFVEPVSPAELSPLSPGPPAPGSVAMPREPRL